MVSRQANRCKTLILVFVTSMIVGFIVTMCVANLLKMRYIETSDSEFDGCPTIGGSIVDDDGCKSEVAVEKRIDFQNLVDEWASSVDGKKGIIIYDLLTDEVVGEYDADGKFATASLYKLFVVYEGYRLVQSGEWSKEMAVSGTGYTVSKCLDLAIRESHSGCAETLWGMIGRDELDAVVQNEFGLADLSVGSLMATPREIMQMLKIYYEHAEITDEDLIAMMQDSFLNQPATTYDWRQGLPSGFSDAVHVYNKVGWNNDGRRWTIYDDAAIVDFVDSGRQFIVVVMTSGIDFKEIARFGSMFEKEYLESTK